MANIRTILASTVAHLDSNVLTGGGTDDTAALQKVLDIAKEEGGVRLVMDGAALVSGLEVWSNTTIECLNADCGFFQIADSNRAIVTNRIWDRKDIQTRNVSLLGGTYNQDCRNQRHDVPHETCLEQRDFNLGVPSGNHWIFAVEFYGVENLLMRDMKILDFRTFCVTIGNFRNVTIENVWIDLPHRLQAQNQDGFHFWGPGQFLTVRDVGGKVGDDFMNLGPDEGDNVSNITDVLVDGVFLDDADQAIRILSRGTGTIDRCTIRNVQGSYRSFGFYINPWFPDVTAGNFGDIFIENVNLTHTAPNYDYRPPMLFCVGGDIRCLTLKNIRHEYPIDKRAIGEFGLPFYATTPKSVADFVFPAGKKPVIRNLIIDGLTVLENEQSADMEDLQVFGEIGNLILRHVFTAKDAGVARSGHLLSVKPCGHVGRLIANDVVCLGEKTVIDGEEFVDELHTDAMIAE